MQVLELERIDDIQAAHWNALSGTDCPFLRHEFLAALEHSGCVGGNTGWTPAHVALIEDGRLVAAAPVYRKAHSWGEFVFDFGWAQAHERHGFPYYPKLLMAVPFSPVNSARMLLAPDRPADPMRKALITALMSRCTGEQLSSAHALFVSTEEAAALKAQGWLLRGDVQFHWHNRGYASFDAYLATFRSEKRKQIRRERRRASEAGVRFLTLHGSDITPAQLSFAFDVHKRNFHLHGHEPYLNLAFFQEIARTLGGALMIKLAVRADEPVAAAVFMVSRAALYGRYWGSIGDFHSLHFETCYHQGIEYCIQHDIGRFEPGTQGEHKIVRGFEPSATHSAHFIADPRFRRAIAEFVEREREAIEDYSTAAAAHVPFHRQ
jgi:predicted N-acyltransferase